MGQSVERSFFEHRDFVRFQRALRAETAWLHDLVERDQLSHHAPMAGLELEAWLVDADGRAAPHNAEFIGAARRPRWSPTIARFNIEINVAAAAGARPAAWAVWRRHCTAPGPHCGAVAAAMGLRVAAIGILPSLADAELSTGQPVRAAALPCAEPAGAARAPRPTDATGHRRPERRGLRASTKT